MNRLQFRGSILVRVCLGFVCVEVKSLLIYNYPQLIGKGEKMVNCRIGNGGIFWYIHDIS